jgi:hypothetical protein
MTRSPNRTARAVIAGTLTAITATVVALVLTPGGAQACGITYQDEPGPATPDCAATASVAAVAVVAGAAVLLALGVAVARYLRGATATNVDVLVQAQAAPDAVADVAQQFGLADNAQAVQALADAYQVVTAHMAPFVVKVAADMLRDFRTQVAAEPHRRFMFLGRDGEALALVIRELDPQFYERHCASVVISRVLGENALRDLENFFQETSPEHRRLGRELRPSDEYLRRREADSNVRRQVQHLTTYLRGRGIPVGEPGSVVTVVDSSFKGSVQAMLSTMFRQTRFDGAYIWHGRHAPVRGDLSYSKKGYAQTVGPGDRGNTWETNAYENLLRGPRSSPTRIGKHGRPQQVWERETADPLEGLDPARISERYRQPLVRDAVREVSQRAVADYARRIAPSKDPGAELDAGYRAFRHDVRNWSDRTADVPTGFREILDSFVPWKGAKA